MNRHPAILASVLLAALLFAGCGAGLPADVATLGYANRTERFAMNVPPAWQVREQNATPQVFLVGPENAAGLRPNVNVIVEPAGDGATLDAWAVQNRARLESLQDFQLVSEETRELAGGLKARVTTFRHGLAGKTVQQRQMVAMTGGSVYIVTATDGPETFAADEPSFEIVLKSFRAGW
jgi:hypothetical protein